MMGSMTVPIMTLVALIAAPVNVECSRDGFNMYKDLLLLRGKADGVDDGSDQLGDDVPNIPKLYFYRRPLLAPHSDGLDYMLGRESVDGSLESVDSESSNEDSQKGSVLGDRFPLPRTIVKGDTGRRYTFTVCLKDNNAVSSVHAALWMLLKHQSFLLTVPKCQTSWSWWAYVIHRNHGQKEQQPPITNRGLSGNFFLFFTNSLL